MSAWMLRSRTGVRTVAETLRALRVAVLDVAGIDAAHEPVPLLGRSDREDALNLAAYFHDLLDRAVVASDCERDDLVERTLARVTATTHDEPGDDDAPLAPIIPLQPRRVARMSQGAAH